MSFYTMKKGWMCLAILLLLCFVIHKDNCISYSRLSAGSEDWIDGPVKHIMTIEEANLYKNLVKKEEKARFVEWFWARRDFNSETIRNEFQDEFNRRAKYVDIHFNESELEGWRTARGRVYIILGPPSQEKLETISPEMRPAIVWHYERSHYLNSEYVLVFLDKMGDGHYCLREIVPMNRSVENYHTIIQKTSFSELIPEEWVSFFDKVNEKAIVRPDLKLEDALSKIFLNDIVELEQIPFHWNIKFVPLSKEEIQAKISISLPYKEINFYQKGNQYYVHMSISVRLYKMGKELAAKLNDEIIAQLTEEELMANPEEDLEYRTSFMVVPGEYTIELTLTDIYTGISNKISEKLIILNKFY
jgi:GWxTD domain-containing protein